MRHGERPECAGKPDKLGMGTVGGSGRRECEEANMALEEVTAKLVCRSLAIVLAIVCPRGGSRTGRLRGQSPNA